MTDPLLEYIRRHADEWGMIRQVELEDAELERRRALDEDRRAKKEVWESSVDEEKRRHDLSECSGSGARISTILRLCCRLILRRYVMTKSLPKPARGHLSELRADILDDKNTSERNPRNHTPEHG